MIPGRARVPNLSLATYRPQKGIGKDHAGLMFLHGIAAEATKTGQYRVDTPQKDSADREWYLLEPSISR